MCVLPLMVMLSVIAAPVHAQETDTERGAARDVLQKMATLEQSLNVPAMVTTLTAPDQAREAVVNRAKDLMSTELLALADDITTHPEIGFEEKRSVQKLTDYLKQHDFSVQVGVAGLDTAFVARYNKNNGGPNLGIIVEYDALRGTKGAFHGDQHSAQGPIGLAAAVAISEWLTRTHTPGSVIVFGTPGEEMMPPNAKTVMDKAGVFNGTDILVRSHSTSATTHPAPGFGTCCMNIDGVKYTFSGAPSHQLTAWNGRNALEGVIHLFTNIDAIRSSIRPEARIQGNITQGGAAPNVVPDLAQADFYIRYPDEVYLQQITDMVDNAAKGAALATGTKVKIDHYGHNRDGISVATLSDVGFAFMKQYGATDVVPEAGRPTGYEETGSVSREIPGVGFTAQTSTFPNHTYGMLDDATKEIGHHGFTVDAQAMTALLYEFATHPEFRQAVQREFSGIQALFAEYLADLQKVYTVPTVPDPPR
ncbi:MAG TPA: peptidase dimerization domain-containing protein [Vicinamibacterales bacterium]